MKNLVVFTVLLVALIQISQAGPTRTLSDQWNTARSSLKSSFKLGSESAISSGSSQSSTHTSSSKSEVEKDPVQAHLKVNLEKEYEILDIKMTSWNTNIKAKHPAISDEMTTLKCDKCYNILFNGMLEGIKLCSKIDYETKKEAALKMFDGAYQQYINCIKDYTQSPVDKKVVQTTLKTIFTQSIDGIIQANGRIAELKTQQ